MGGVPPLGYRVQDRKLVTIDSEAELLRSIFCRYAELGSLRLLKDELEVQGSKSKSWTSAASRVIGVKLFSRGALYLMLRNHTYRGEIVHKGQSHPGERPLARTAEMDIRRCWNCGDRTNARRKSSFTERLIARRTVGIDHPRRSVLPQSFYREIVKVLDLDRAPDAG